MRTITKRLGPATAVLAAALMAWAWLAPQALAAQPIRIGVMASGKSFAGSRAIFQGAKLAAENINANGGVNGRKMKLYNYDTKFSASKAARGFQRAVQQDHVKAMVGIYTSEVALAMMPWAARLKTPLLISAAASPQIPKRVKKHYGRYKYVFHAYFNSTLIAKATCIFSKDIFLNNKKLSYLDRAVIFSEDAKWTKPLDRGYKNCLSKAGFKVVDTISFSPDTTDFRPLYNRVRQDKANLIIAGLAHVGLKAVVQWHRQQVPAFMGGVNALSGASSFWKASNGAADGVTNITSGLKGIELTPKAPAFYKAYTQQFDIQEPAFDAYTTYDAIYALKHAIEKAGSTKADAMTDALEQVNFTGVTGQIHYHGKHSEWPHEVAFNPDPEKGMSFVGTQWQNGKQVVLWPKSLAEGKVEIPSFVPQPSQ
jgi:branched-chain amino acid transport system substrate-binding protein